MHEVPIEGDMAAGMLLKVHVTCKHFVHQQAEVIDNLLIENPVNEDCHVDGNLIGWRTACSGAI